MSMDNLKELYIDLLQDTYSANKQGAEMIEKLIDEASNDELCVILENAQESFRKHNENLKKLVEGHDSDPTDEHCKGMEGLVKEAKAHAIDADFGDEDTQDAMIIAQFQRMVHYGLAAYGTCAAMSKRLKLNNDNTVLNKDLDSLYSFDKNLSKLAEGEINPEAMAA